MLMLSCCFCLLSFSSRAVNEATALSIWELACRCTCGKLCLLLPVLFPPGAMPDPRADAAWAPAARLPPLLVPVRPLLLLAACMAVACGLTTVPPLPNRSPASSDAATALARVRPALNCSSACCLLLLLLLLLLTALALLTLRPAVAVGAASPLLEAAEQVPRLTASAVAARCRCRRAR